MGGKTWSRDEELYFWHTVVPVSPKAAVHMGDPADWEQCASMMKRHFGARARRNYTKLMLFEHYFQNIATGHESPRAADLVAEHRRHLAAHGKTVDEVPPGRRPRARRATRTDRLGDANSPERNPDDQSRPRSGGPAPCDATTTNGINSGTPGPRCGCSLSPYHRPGCAAGIHDDDAICRGPPTMPQGRGLPWAGPEDSAYGSVSSPSA